MIKLCRNTSSTSVSSKELPVMAAAVLVSMLEVPEPEPVTAEFAVSVAALEAGDPRMSIRHSLYTHHRIAIFLF